MRRIVLLAAVLAASACAPGQSAGAPSPQPAVPTPASAGPSPPAKDWAIKRFDTTGTTGDWNMHASRTALEPRYRICAYDSADLGQSDPTPQPRTIQQISDDLAALLKAADVPGPYFLVGISAGGLYIQDFAQRHPGNVVAPWP